MKPLFSFVALAVCLVACEQRDSVWELPPAFTHDSIGLTGSVAVFDTNDNRVMMVTAQGDLNATITPIAMQHNLVAATTTPGRDKLLLLTQGDYPRKSTKDQGPALSVIDGSANPQLLATYPITNLLSNLAIDPQSQYAVLFASNSGAFVQNPNELAIVDLNRAPGANNPLPVTLRSFGGSPTALFFSGAMRLPSADRRFLVALTDRDVGMVELGDSTHTDITVRLSDSDEVLIPSGVAFSAPEITPPMIAVRLSNSNDVVILELDEPESNTDGANVEVSPNKVPVGGVASDVAFVQTDGGLRLAALVPQKNSLVLVEPETSQSINVQLGAYYDHLKVQPNPAGTGDIGIIWSSNTSSLGIVTLGDSVGKPYRSVETIALSGVVSNVFDVPNAPATKLVALQSGYSFVVLDLVTRTAAPLNTNTGAILTVSPDGLRSTVYSPNSPNVAVVDLASKKPTNVILSYPVQSAFDIARTDNGRALVAIHPTGAGAITLLDAKNPSLTNAREVASFLAGGLP